MDIKGDGRIARNEFPLQFYNLKRNTGKYQNITSPIKLKGTSRECGF